MKQAEDPVCFTKRQNEWTVIKTGLFNITILSVFCKKIYLIIIYKLKLLFLKKRKRCYTIHYNGKRKPWKKGYRGKLAYLWFRFRDTQLPKTMAES